MSTLCCTNKDKDEGNVHQDRYLKGTDNISAENYKEIACNFDISKFMYAKKNAQTNTFDLHLFIMSINSFLPIPVSRNESAALKLGMLSYGCSAREAAKSWHNLMQGSAKFNYHIKVSNVLQILFYST